MNKQTLTVLILIFSIVLNALLFFIVFNLQPRTESLAQSPLQKVAQALVPSGEIMGVTIGSTTSQVQYSDSAIQGDQTYSETSQAGAFLAVSHPEPTQDMVNTEHKEQIIETSATVTQLLQSVDVSLAESAVYLRSVCHRDFTNDEASDALNRTFVYLHFDDADINKALLAILTDTSITSVVQELAPHASSSEVFKQLCK